MPDDRPASAGTRAPTLYRFEDAFPTIAPDAYVAPTAVIVGDVTIGPKSSVWYHCVLRGDTNFIRIGARSNIQDGTVLHVNRARFPCLIGDDVTVGHAAVIHACTLENRAFVGIQATVLDGAVIEEGGMLAAHALLTPGKRVGKLELWAGAPAKLVRKLTPEERAGFDATTRHYVDLAQRHRVGAVPVR